jgi:hypothetical protein
MNPCTTSPTMLGLLLAWASSVLYRKLQTLALLESQLFAHLAQLWLPSLSLSTS